MKVNIKLNHKNINKITKGMKKSLLLTADAIKTDLVESQTMPFGETKYNSEGKVIYKGGNLQNTKTTVDKSNVSNGKVSIVSDTPYARRLYFHPEYKFNKKQNPNAGGRWFHPYIDGDKKKYSHKLFRKFMEKEIK